MYRIGLGTDIHPLVLGRPLSIGGVLIESDLGADGHSDADALLHAITDAILGALAQGDIGTHFPNNEERWRNAESVIFLRYAVGLMKENGFEVANLDSTVHIERPKIRKYVDAIRVGLAEALEVTTGRISVKAKTGEGIDAVGEQRAIRADAVILLAKRDS